MPFDRSRREEHQNLFPSDLPAGTYLHRKQRSLAGGQALGLGGFSRNHSQKLARKLMLIIHLCLLFYDRNLSSLMAVSEKLILSAGVISKLPNILILTFLCNHNVQTCQQCLKKKTTKIKEKNLIVSKPICMERVTLQKCHGYNFFHLLNFFHFHFIP